MGLINRFLSADMFSRFKFEHFVETGTGLGYSLITAIQYGFRTIKTVDLDPEAVKRSGMFVRDPRIQFFTGRSEDELVNMCEPGVTLFWLDAHFPFSFTGTDFSEEKDPLIRLPLEKEISIIRENKSDYTKDVFIIDDLRIYEDGPFEDGNWSLRGEIGGDGIGFIEDAFSKTHVLTRDFRDQGYIILIPR